MVFPVQNEIERLGKNDKYGHQKNFKQALKKKKNVIVLLFQRTITLIEELQGIFAQTIESI